ncbi:MAG: hypothetical protein AAGD01_18000 [Acidobacteriota bacterium]
MKLFSTRVVVLFLFSCALLGLAPVLPAETTVYVWEFSWRSGEEDSLTQSVTREFEEALIGLRGYRVVEGRAPGALKEQLDNVRAIRTILDIPQSQRDLIASYDIDQVVLGELFDDIDSGEVVLSITLQRLDGTKVQATSSSVSRGKIRDRETRVELVRSLVNRLSSRSRAVHEASGLDYQIRVEECTGAGRTITCDLELLNDGEDRKAGIYSGNCGDESFMIDEFNSTFSSTHVRLGNQVQERRCPSVETFLVSGIPTPVKLTFDGASSRAQRIALLDVGLLDRESGTTKRFKFRNVDIQRAN